MEGRSGEEKRMSWRLCVRNDEIRGENEQKIRGEKRDQLMICVKSKINKKKRVKEEENAHLYPIYIIYYNTTEEQDRTRSQGGEDD